MKQKILIVDDDKNIAKGLWVRLKAVGYEVFEAFDGLEGLKLAATHRPDLILLDLWMPHSGGVLMAQRLKHIGLEDVPVIFLTAGKKEALWSIAQDVNPAGFFEKPYDSKQLLESIALALRGRHAVPADTNYEEDTDC
jgi:DNA-binding response OmpR family regulator